MPVMIAGAGIGGLALALSLEKLGIDFVVFDAAPELKPLGVGINILPHATGELSDSASSPRSRKSAFGPESFDTSTNSVN